MDVNYNLFEELLLRMKWDGHPSGKERVLSLLNAVSINFIQFKKELEPPSSAIIALSANCGNDLASSLSCALNCVTGNHLLLERICDFLERSHKNPVESLRGEIIPGMGHPSIKGSDPRVEFLLTEFSDISGKRVEFYQNLDKKITPVNINIGGAMCALMLDAGIKQEYILYFPLIGRLFGWCETYIKTNKNFKKVVPSHKIINENNK
jgi:citrate synthase|tara:strand:- start:1286 stop:1909 length:624 start_codon:yes stop_codon:yes gene_type:complete